MSLDTDNVGGHLLKVEPDGFAVWRSDTFADLVVEERRTPGVPTRCGKATGLYCRLAGDDFDAWSVEVDFGLGGEWQPTSRLMKVEIPV
jgi:hypothetical protein